MAVDPYKPLNLDPPLVLYQLAIVNLYFTFGKYILNAQKGVLIMLAASFYTLLFGGLF